MNQHRQPPGAPANQGGQFAPGARPADPSLAVPITAPVAPQPQTEVKLIGKKAPIIYGPMKALEDHISDDHKGLGLLKDCPECDSTLEVVADLEVSFDPTGQGVDFSEEELEEFMGPMPSLDALGGENPPPEIVARIEQVKAQLRKQYGTIDSMEEFLTSRELALMRYHQQVIEDWRDKARQIGDLIPASDLDIDDVYTTMHDSPRLYRIKGLTNAEPGFREAEVEALIGARGEPETTMHSMPNHMEVLRIADDLVQNPRSPKITGLSAGDAGAKSGGRRRRKPATTSSSHSW